MTTTVFTDGQRPADFLKALWDERYQMVAGTIKNVTGGTIAQGAVSVGSPLNLNGSQWETVNKTGESGADGFLVDDTIVPELANNAISTKKYRILVRGPALVNPDAIPDDPDGSTGAYVLADLITRLAALNPPIMVLRNNNTTSTQTT